LKDIKLEIVGYICGKTSYLTRKNYESHSVRGSKDWWIYVVIRDARIMLETAG
jgi:hypothetical protein